MAKAANHWYIVRVKPGTQRMAAAIPGLPPHRKGESIFERQCREAGVDCYMPSFWETALHQRTNKLIEKRCPFLVGYAFLNVGGEGFYSAFNVDSVQSFIKSAGAPVSFPEPHVSALMLAEFERKQTYDFERMEREHLHRQYRRNALNRSLGLIFPKGRRKKIPLRMIAEGAIESLSPPSRQRVNAIINELKALDYEESACNSGTSYLESVA